MKNKAFTLIELLAVIIILGILMLIAIPSVTNYINNSRKSTYVNTIDSLIKGTIAKVNSGDLNMFDTDTTYYVPCTCIKLENGEAKSPYGKFDPAYVVVTFDGTNYNYYFTGKDVQNMGVPTLTSSDILSKESIVANVEAIDTSVGIEGTSNVYIFSDECNGEGEIGPAGTTVSGGSSSGGSSGSGSSSSGSTNFATEISKLPSLRDVDGNKYYYGDSVDNYVSFNDEVWRIIGVFDVKNGSKTEKRVKLMRAESIGEHMWDYSKWAEQNSDFGINNWATSDLVSELNGDYLNYNLTTDKTWAGNKTFNHNYVLKQEAQMLIDNAVWYLGASRTSSSRSVAEQFASERSDQITTDPKDTTLVRTTKWTGKVGLMYASDYGYASNDTETYEEWNCMNNIGYTYCKNGNWLFTGNYEWTISPTTQYENVLYIHRNGYVAHTDPNAFSHIRPCVYLKQSVKFVSGDGSSSNPYKISK